MKIRFPQNAGKFLTTANRLVSEEELCSMEYVFIYGRKVAFQYHFASLWNLFVVSLNFCGFIS
jgi:hypothetical protein